MKLWAKTTVNAQELFVHYRGKREGAEGLHAGIVYPLGVFVLAFELEGEIIGQMSALVVSS